MDKETLKYGIIRGLLATIGVIAIIGWGVFYSYLLTNEKYLEAIIFISTSIGLGVAIISAASYKGK